MYYSLLQGSCFDPGFVSVFFLVCDVRASDLALTLVFIEIIHLNVTRAPC